MSDERWKETPLPHWVKHSSQSFSELRIPDLPDAKAILARYPRGTNRISSKVPWRVTFKCNRNHALITVQSSPVDGAVLLWPVPEHEEDRWRAFWLPNKSTPGWHACVAYACAFPVEEGKYFCAEHEDEPHNMLVGPAVGLICRRCKKGELRIVRAKLSTLIERYVQAADVGSHTAVVPG